MGFKTDGTSHRHGISGEQLTLEIISSRHTRTFGTPRSVEARGGTQFKEDLIIPSTGQKISCKNRQSSGGTYDYMNSSKIFTELAKKSDSAKSLKDYTLSVKGGLSDGSLHKRGSEAVNLVKSECRSEVKRLVKNVLQSLKPEELGNIIMESVSEYIEDDYYFTITHVPTGELRIFPSKALPLFKYLSSSEPKLFALKPGSSASRTVLFGEQECDYGVRLRLGLNNGVGALLGGKNLSSNSSSTLVIKIQQDNPDKQFESIDDELVEVLKI
jgi:hypothetical protein